MITTRSNRFVKTRRRLKRSILSSLDVKTFFKDMYFFLISKLRLAFTKFEYLKTILVNVLYRQRGKYAKRFVHSGMAGLTALGILIAPILADEFPSKRVNPWDIPSPSSVVSASTDATTTLISEKARDKIIKYTVQTGDTLSSIADKFNISTDTILWQNSLTSKDKIKEGQELEILPVTGILHKVAKGDTVYSIAKKYDTSPQSIVDFPFNTFVNDETFELAVGQTIVVPDGVKPQEIQLSPRVKRITPNAGTVVASGNFVWPAGGSISQNFTWYHRGIDIANRAAPDTLAADSGTVITAGWTSVGYGYHIIIDHGNGYRTLYGHLQRLYVVEGQTVARGNAIGKMGSTGRSTGIHLHFEVILNGAYLNPLNVLK